ncbi:hypothetical protein PRIPAC_96513 [Pristionchus pacificus]|uniref:Uncharacterized protein n=1 Tax=Pristionchus pacificus TaxID=54126 RepID=A0A2A6BD26_PRIPA|nr:hypothetical protein PRIPAC_96513 [Pristionchus pacificus]|eukprot:PDM63774.1 hypothetical protein PRIPAC_49747 [Pristionchus pacificus]
MTSQTSLLLIALCMGMASAGLFRNCARLHHVVNLPYIAPTIADIGKCPPGCEPESYSPIQIIYVKEGKGQIVENEENGDLVIQSCKASRRH